MGPRVLWIQHRLFSGDPPAPLGQAALSLCTVLRWGLQGHGPFWGALRGLGLKDGDEGSLEEERAGQAGASLAPRQSMEGCHPSSGKQRACRPWKFGVLACPSAWEWRSGP